MLSGARCAKRVRLAKHGPKASSSIVRILHNSPPLSHSFALPIHAGSPAPTTAATDFRQRIVEQKFEDINEILNRKRSSPARAWASYIELLNFVGLHQIPLEIHQKVLRACTTDSFTTRQEFSRRLGAGASPHAPHPHESRFRAVIQNIREASHTPALEDYQFIIQQFAAIGYHFGALRVLQEISHLGLPMTSKTFGLCLQALCHRLALPCSPPQRPKLVAECATICSQLTRQMRFNGVTFTSGTIDLVYRVLKETMNMQTLETLLKVAYGIDLAYPDRPPLEFWQHGQTSNQPDDSSAMGLPAPLVFSTSALNTTVDILGSLGRISKLVQTFEVLTTPLPSRLATVPSSSFDDDEEDDFGVNRPAVASFPLPYAEPNTRTIQILLKWICQSKHAVLARHYLLHAMSHDRQVDRRLRGDTYQYPPEMIFAPNFSVNRNMLLSVFGLANRNKNMELLRWVLMKTQKVLRRKVVDITYYSGIQAKWDTATMKCSTAQADTGKTIEGGETSRSATDLEDMPAEQEGPPTSYFEVDLDSSATPQSRRRMFDIRFHLSLLERDKLQIEELERDMIDVFGPEHAEGEGAIRAPYLGQKTVYLRILGKRVRVHRSEWVDRVNFRPSREVKHGENEGEDTKANRGPFYHPLKARATPSDYFTSATFQD